MNKLSEFFKWLYTLGTGQQVLVLAMVIIIGAFFIELVRVSFSERDDFNKGQNFKQLKKNRNEKYN